MGNCFQSVCVAAWEHGLKSPWIVVLDEMRFGRLIIKVVKESQLKVVLLHLSGGLHSFKTVRRRG
jgi:hypothetical protein